MKTSVIGYPRIGANRELKRVSEAYFKENATETELAETAAQIRRENWIRQSENHIDFIPVGDFSLYDNVLDMEVRLGLVPARYRALNLSATATYFAMARGFSAEQGDVKAFAMKKWFGTNYHYLVPEIEDDAVPTLADESLFTQVEEAKAAGISPKVVLIGAYTFLKLARFTGTKTATDFADAIADVYGEILTRLGNQNVTWVAFDEPSLVMDMTEEEKSLLTRLYTRILAKKGATKVLIQTYFGDVRDCYSELCALDIDGIGMDFLDGKMSLALVEENGFPKDKTLFAGVLCGKNIWKNNIADTVALLQKLQAYTDNIVIGTSCSLLHVPCTLKNETDLSADILQHFAFAEEKLVELATLSDILASDTPTETPAYQENVALFAQERVSESVDPEPADDVQRIVSREERRRVQADTFNLPLLPTTTIGSFPQTAEVRAKRAAFRKGEITETEYNDFLKEHTAKWVKIQEDLGIDVLVHGEFERVDMVEYFGQHLDGFLFTKNGWVQSYGTRCVKPPIIWGDVARREPITVEWSVYAQSLTEKPMKAMLTGPVTILNWSFPREDVARKTSAMQIAIAIREEIADLVKAGLSIIQVDEAALREKLPLRKCEWHSEYLDWAIKAFRMVHCNLPADIQLHTHMCYSEFSDIIDDIDAMDADVITFEASRSDLTLLDTLQQHQMGADVGPGVYDIHSPRVPSEEEFESVIRKMVAKIPADRLWVNPDCGLKTRGETETLAALENMVQAAKKVRADLTKE